MSLEFELPLVSLIFILIISIVYFSKRKIDLIENKAYKVILICSLIETIIDLVIHIICSLNEFSVIQGTYYNLFNFLNKFLSMLFIIIFSSLFYYITLITYKKQNKKIKRVQISIIMINVISAVVLMFTNIKLVDAQNVTNVTGCTIMFGYLIVAFFLFASLVISIMNFKSIDRRYISIFSILGVMSILYTLTLICPGIIIYDLVLAILCYIMYFTIENPDLKVVNELLRNKELVEKGMEEKSRFLFEMSQEIKTPTKNILGIVNNYDKLQDDIDKKDAVRLIGSYANDLIFKLNNILDISSMDARKIKISNRVYDTTNLFNNIKNMTKNAISNKNIKLEFEANSNVPKKLYGDNIKLKQIIMSVLFNCIEHTKEGFISVKIDSIVRYDICRLIVKISDTGSGMNLSTINNILEDNQELNESDITKLDGLDMDLKVTIKTVKFLGGSFNIKSEENKGSTFTIVIDQKCDIEKKSDIMKEIETYSLDVFGKKRVLIVDGDKEEIFKISNMIGKYNIDITTTMFPKDCIDRIKAGELYNLIIVNDELKNSSAMSVLKQLKEIKKFKVPVIVMLDKSKEHLKNYYIEDGFKDFIIKDNMAKDIKKIINSL